MNISFDEVRICINEDSVGYRLTSPFPFPDDPNSTDISRIPQLLSDWRTCIERLQPGDSCYLPFCISLPGHDLEVVNCFEAARRGELLHLYCIDLLRRERDLFPPDVLSFAFSRPNIVHRYEREFGVYPVADFVSALKQSTNDRNA